MKLRVGIFFGGPSREREISFAGGRTVYDNLDKALFKPIPIFVDSFRHFVLLDWQHIYKGSIRDFFPPIEQLPESPNHFQVYQESLGAVSEAELRALQEAVGTPLLPEELARHIDIAFLALHGLYGEDGQIQQQLQELGIPYTGSGVEASRIGMDKAWQKERMQALGFPTPRIELLQRDAWPKDDPDALFEMARERIGFPLVVRPSRQGSSIGVSILDEKAGPEGLAEAVRQAFFQERIPLSDWRERSAFERVDHIRLLTDIRDGLTFPMTATLEDEQLTLCHPEALLEQLDRWAERYPNDVSATVELESFHLEDKVLLEAFIHGKEFSCIVLRLEDGRAVALPPTEIVKTGKVYDYRSKYLPGLSRKRTPIDLPEDQVHAIRQNCERLFSELGFQVYARIDGFIQEDGTIFLNDPNTTSGMLPSSFFFHQAAEIGLNPSQFLTYILRISLQERLAEDPEQHNWQQLLLALEAALRAARTSEAEARRVGIILGGYSYERHISVESGRNIYEKLASSESYDPIPLFLSRSSQGSLLLHRLPVNLLLKDNADDILDAIQRPAEEHPALPAIRAQFSEVTAKYASTDVIFSPEAWSFDRLPEQVDAVFIALHGRPGEDGEVQRLLDERGIPYNGSGPVSSGITIDKYRTLQTLKANGFPVADQQLIRRMDFLAEPDPVLAGIAARFGFPLVAKPVDDGCSSAVKVIQDESGLRAYLELLFREPGTDRPDNRRKLRIHPAEEFPHKEVALIESLIRAEGAVQFLEITGGILTHRQADGSLRYEVFEPSETLASGEVLSLEEKFLAGEGQNLTPARFGGNGIPYEAVARQVKADLERAARILMVEGYCRIDAFVRVYSPEQVETIIIEVNSLPGMTPATCIFHQAAINHYKPYEFIDRILQYGVAKKENRHSAAAPEDREDEAAPSPTSTLQPKNPTYAMGDFAPSGSNPRWRELADRLLDGLRNLLRQLWAFVSSPVFLKNLAVWLVLLSVLFLLLLGWLRLYTKHGESLQVHNYVGMELEDAMKLARNRSFKIEVSDSVFQIDKSPGTVIQQDPPAESRVKKNRTIYLVINRKNPPMVALPDLSGSDDFQVYCDYLRRLDIDCVVKERVYHGRLEPNTILHFYHEGRKITASELKRGVKVPRGATLEFVITERRTGTVPIPNLLCTGYAEAEFIIANSKLAVGAVYGGVEDLDGAYVYRQDPPYQEGRQIPIGTQVNLYIQQNRPADCPTDNPFPPEGE